MTGSGSDEGKMKRVYQLYHHYLHYRLDQRRSPGYSIRSSDLDRVHCSRAIGLVETESGDV